jgi:proteasome assembly chaperone (PAC2) family protein
MLEIDTWPRLQHPVLVVALTGWIDAGMAGAGTVAVLAEQLESSRRFGHVDLADLMDLQQTRPTVQLVDGATRAVTWPSIELIAGRAGCDVVLCVGPEPSLRWRQLMGELVDMARRLDVYRVFTVGGMPSVASHRRPVSVLATATSPELVIEIGAWRADYHGPTGLQTALQVALGDAGIPTIALWAQVPHYVAGSPSPPAIAALLARLRELGGVQVDVGDLTAQSEAYVRRVEEGLTERPDVAEVVRAIEAETPEPQIPTGDELASEIERYLQQRPDQG